MSKNTVTVHETATYIAVLDEEGYLFDAFGQDYTWSITPLCVEDCGVCPLYQPEEGGCMNPQIE